MILIIMRILKTITLLLGLFGSIHSYAFNIGFNQAWFKSHYSTQYLDGRFDENEVHRIFKMANDAYAKEIRLWFFESSNFPMIRHQSPNEIGFLRADYINNVIRMLQIAQSYNLKIYMTIFDAHTYRPDKLNQQQLQKLRRLFQDEGTKNFLENIMTPLLQEIHKYQLSNVISKIDLINEGDTVINRFGFDGGWKGVKRFICQWKNHLQNIDGFRNTPVTLSLRLHPLIFHPHDLLADDGPLACADVVDFHSYDDDGEIYRCHAIKKYANLKKKKLILGEFGQNYFNHRYSDALQLLNTYNYIKNAQECGFDEALAWRLSDVREGYNKEARYSFEAFGRPRPSYYLIQEANRPK